MKFFKRKPKCPKCQGKGRHLVYSPFRYPSPSVIGYTHIRAATRKPYYVPCASCRR